MSAAIAKAADFTNDQIELIKRTVCVGGTNDELTLFLSQCRKTGLDPFTRQIYAIKRQGKMTIQVGIDGYRLIADRTGLYAGNDDPVYDNEEKPTKATVTVYKLVGGVRCPFTATARWSQYFPGDAQGFMWKKMPHLMLGKCAEGLALRKAFPVELSGIYTTDEMEQADEVPATTPAPPAQPLKATTVIEPKPEADPVKSAEALDALLAQKGKVRATAFRYLSGKVGVSYPADFNWLEIPADHRALLVDTIRSMPDCSEAKAGA